MMQHNVKIFEKKPDDFNAKVDVAAAYIEVDGKILLLQLSENKKHSKCWGVPAGKFEQGEAPENALRRELFEETGIFLTENTSVHSIGQLYIRKPEIDYVFHAFKVDLESVPEIILSDEHIAYNWVSIDEAKKLDLLDGEETILHFLSHSKRKRPGTNVNVYMVLRKENEVLLHLRKNTGYCDSFYGLVSGHVEDSEPATAAIIREAQEEAGIELDSSSLRVVHVLHRKTNRLNIDLFFECDHWQGDITNKEPEKCASLDFFSIDNLPFNTIDYIKDALQAISANKFYSEVGWT